MSEMPGYADDFSAIPLEDWCLWSDQSMGWDLPDDLQMGDTLEYITVDKDGGSASDLRWERVARQGQPGLHSALSWRRVRLPLSLLHPGLHDVEFWTLDLRSTVLLFVVVIVLVTFGMAVFTLAR